MKTVNYMSDSLQEYFTADAWKQFSSYLQTLAAELEAYNIPEKQARTTYKGIEDYILGYRSELGKDTKITFRQMLTLIDEIGSPQEIIQDLQISQSTKTTADGMAETKFCPECGAKMERSEIYCNYCGRNTTVDDRQFSPLKQKIIDNPYSAGMFISFGGAGLMGVIIGIIIFIGVLQGAEVSISFDFGFVILVAIILSIIGMLIGGLINSIYKDYVSFNQRYDRLRGELDNNYLTGHFIFAMTVLAYSLIGIFHRNALVGSPEGNPSAVILMVLSLIYLPLSLTFRGSVDPNQLSYYQLLVLKNRVGHNIENRLIQFNKKLIMPLVVVSVVWHFLLYEPRALDSAYFAIPGYIMFLLLFLAINGLYYSYRYSWNVILEQS